MKAEKVEKTLEEKGLNLGKVKFILAWYKKTQNNGEMYIDPKHK